MPSESSEVTASEAKKFTVAQLKAALESRGLPTDGRKDALLARLLETLEGETAGDLPEENENGGDESEDSGRKRKRDEDIADEDEGDETRKRAAREESEEAPGPMPGPEPTNGDDDEGDEVGPTFDMIAPGNGDEDEDVGPMPSGGQARKKQRRLAYEKLYLDNLPDAEMYERSLMHRDTVNFCRVAPRTDFIVTTSIDGHVKFWKKMERGIEFVKHYRAHLGAVVALDISFDGTLLATAGADKFLKVFDVVNFDMINMIKLDFAPRAVCWVFERAQARPLVAVSDKDSPAVHLFDGRAENDSGLVCTASVHPQPVGVMRYHHRTNTVVSIDDQGNVEYWIPRPEAEFAQPKPPSISWTYKSDTDLFEFRKCKAVPTSLEFSPDGRHFVTTGFADRQVRIFSFATGKLVRRYDESLQCISEMQQGGTAFYTLDDMEFGRRMALEREIEKQPNMGQAATMNAVFDETGNFVIYPTLLGIKVVNIRTNKVARIVGRGETVRFMNVSMYQGAPKQQKLVTLEMAASDNPLFKDQVGNDPTLFATVWKRNRFFLFSRREPEAEDAPGGSGRDVFNEKPSREDQVVAQLSAQSAKQSLGSSAIVRTTMGDIHVRLFPEYAPKAVENWVGLAKKGYYDNLTFHRVIRNFMIQTGDPLGDGTGGDSIWGADFEDEFHKGIKHDRPYTVSMANAGPNTNASQFFITVVPTPWLDNKHTIFGRATAGFDVIHKIEQAKTDRHERPLEPIKILSIEVR